MKIVNVIVAPTIAEREHMAEEKLRNIIRKRREEECFPYINRGRLWYNRLSDAQLSELARWYEDWLNATETKITPKAPIWLNSKMNEEDFL